ncbi:hypothetical protein HN51_012094 [Arachis hypogaea]
MVLSLPNRDVDISMLKEAVQLVNEKFETEIFMTKFPENSLVIEEVEVTPPKAGEVHLKILYTSFCHTNLGHKARLHYFFEYLVMKLEGMIVESVRKGVTHLKPSDHVLPVFTEKCGECPHCK